MTEKAKAALTERAVRALRPLSEGEAAYLMPMIAQMSKRLRQDAPARARQVIETYPVFGSATMQAAKTAISGFFP